jgi:hypothetical protein
MHKSFALISALVFGVCLLNAIFGSWWNIRVLRNVEISRLELNRFTAISSHLSSSNDSFLYTAPSIWPESLDDQLHWIYYGIQNALTLNKTFVVPKIMGKSFDMYFDLKGLSDIVRIIEFDDFLFECRNEIDVVYYKDEQEPFGIKKKAFSQTFEKIHHFVEFNESLANPGIPRCTVLNFFIGGFGNYSRSFFGYDSKSSPNLNRIISRLSVSPHIKEAAEKFIRIESIKENVSLCADIPTRKVAKCSKHFSACLSDKEILRCIRSFKPEIVYLAIESPQNKLKVLEHFHRRYPDTKFIILESNFLDISQEFPGMHSLLEQEICSNTKHFVGNPWSSWSSSVFNYRSNKGFDSLKWWQCSSRPFLGTFYA